jgi:HK97 gp10 family phage protein
MATRVEIHYDQVTACAQEIDRKVWFVATEIRNDARSYAPVRTGALRVSGHVNKLRRGHYHIVFNPKKKQGGGYAVYVEKGTRRMRAQPYLRPAAFKPRAF